jgi:hypothetical protein
LPFSVPRPGIAAPDYTRDVKPLLTRHCVQCHGAQKEEAGLRLGTAEFARLGGSSGSTVKRSRDGESLLTAVIAGTHADIPAMTYKKERIPLRPSVIAAGANFGGGCSFCSPLRLPCSRPPSPASASRSRSLSIGTARVVTTTSIARADWI